MRREVIIKPDKLSERSTISTSVSMPSTPLQPQLQQPLTPTADVITSENKELAIKRSLPYSVDKIIGKRFLGNDGITQYRIFWKNCNINGASWEPKEDVEINCQTLIELYEKGFVMKEEHFEENRYILAMYDYNKNESNELSFHKGDKIKVITPPDNTDQWKEGELNGNIGMFPCNYVKECPIKKEVLFYLFISLYRNGLTN